MTSALSMLHKARQKPVNTDSDQQDAQEGGESMNLDMHVSEQADGGLAVTTAGKSVTHEGPAEDHKVNRRLAQDEENILRHRDPEDPGYNDFDQHYEDREPEL